MPDHTVDHCDSMFCGAVSVFFFVVSCHSEILKLWQTAALVEGTVFMFACYSILAVKKKEWRGRITRGAALCKPSLPSRENTA